MPRFLGTRPDKTGEISNSLPPILRVARIELNDGERSRLARDERFSLLENFRISLARARRGHLNSRSRITCPRVPRVPSRLLASPRVFLAFTRCFFQQE